MNLLTLLAVYLPFEEFFLKWLPVSDKYYLLLRQAPDFIIFFLFIFLLIRQFVFYKKIPLIGYKVDFFLFLFVFWSFSTIILNSDANYFIGLANIKALLRYIPIVYILLCLNPKENQILLILQLIIWISLLQIAIGMYQFFGGIEARNFLAARHVNESIGGIARTFTGDKFENINEFFGTMGDNISYAYFILIGLTISLFTTKINTITYWLASISYSIIIYMSGSRAVTITASMFIVGHYYIINGRHKATKNIFTITMVVIPFFILYFLNNDFITITEQRSFSYIFTSDYIQSAINQRLGILIYIFPTFLSNFHCIIGFSPDKFYFADIVTKTFYTAPSGLKTVLPYVLEDVYWAALVIYYGVIGIFLFILFLYLTYKFLEFSLYNCSNTVRKVSLISMAMLLMSIPLNLFNQAFEVRTFSYYLWLFCGLSIAGLRKTSEENHI